MSTVTLADFKNFSNKTNNFLASEDDLGLLILEDSNDMYKVCKTNLCVCILREIKNKSFRILVSYVC